MLREAELTDFSLPVLSLRQALQSQHPLQAGEMAHKFIEENVGMLYDRGWEGQFDRHKSVSPLINIAYVRADLANALGDVAVRLVWLTKRPRQSNLVTARDACERYLQTAEVDLPDVDNPTGKERPGGRKPPKKRGRKPDTDAEVDKRLANAWKTGQYSTYAALAQEKHITQRDVKLALDRHRKRWNK